MGVSQCGKTIVLKVRVKSRLFLVGPASLAISVSRRAETSGAELSGGEGAGLEGPDFFSFLQLACDKTLVFPSASSVPCSADNTSGAHHHLPSGPRWTPEDLFSRIIFTRLDCLERLFSCFSFYGVNRLRLTR